MKTTSKNMWVIIRIEHIIHDIMKYRVIKSFVDNYSTCPHPPENKYSNIGVAGFNRWLQ